MIQVYDRCYQEEPAANQALFKTMEQLDWKDLLKRVDEGYRPWRVPSAVLYGNKVKKTEVFALTAC
jgi:hypothetical protein